MTRYITENNVRREATAEEIAEIEAREANARIQTPFENSLMVLRDRRNLLLAETDHLALSDQTLSSEMTTYRQALRDITKGLTTVEQVNAVTWPEKPEA